MNCEGQVAGLERLSTKYLILTEGMHDTEFFTNLVSARGIPDDFTIYSCGHAKKKGRPERDGIQHLTGALDGLPVLDGFNKLEGILVVGDSDADINVSFGRISTWIAATAEIEPGIRFMSPAAPMVSSGGTPAIVVMMLPLDGSPGSLDKLCYAAARNKHPQCGAATENFFRVVGADTWTAPKDSKMKLRSIISAAWRADPYIAPAWVWAENTDLVPLDDPEFDVIEQHLRNFGNLLQV